MNEKKAYPLCVVLSMITGRLFCNFSLMHEMVEWFVGHPVWTHEFAEQAFFDRLKNLILEQHPELADFDADKVDSDNYADLLEQAKAKYGECVFLIQRPFDRTENPVESFVRIRENL